MHFGLQNEFTAVPILATISDSVMDASGAKKKAARSRERRDFLQICNARRLCICRLAWQNGATSLP